MTWRAIHTPPPNRVLVHVLFEVGLRCETMLVIKLEFQTVDAAHSAPAPCTPPASPPRHTQDMM